MLIITFLNDGTGNEVEGNYKWQVLLDKDAIAEGTIKGHNRFSGWEGLVNYFALAVAGEYEGENEFTITRKAKESEKCLEKVKIVEEKQKMREKTAKVTVIRFRCLRCGNELISFESEINKRITEGIVCSYCNHNMLPSDFVYQANPPLKVTDKEPMQVIFGKNKKARPKRFLRVENGM